MTGFSTPASYLKLEYEQQKVLFESQPAIVQRFLESQAGKIADGLISRVNEVRFSLPDRVVVNADQSGQQATIAIPEAQRDQEVGGFWTSMSRREVRLAIQRRLQELEQSPDQAIAMSAGLLRFAAATYLVFNSLPGGRAVTYRPNGDETIPSIPIGDNAPESAITQGSDAITEQDQVEPGRGELHSPFVPAARKFFLPQWVAFDEKGKLLVNSEQAAEARVTSMQRYAQILHRASTLAPYMVACKEYQRKRYGILGQLINQGRALAIFKTGAIIREIQERSAKDSLNRGLSISMPYFDDQTLVMDIISFDVIPAGRIMFIPAFVVLAARSEQAKVSQDTRLNSSTRKHLLAQLHTLEIAFQSK
jgi:hypothetical protein